MRWFGFIAILLSSMAFAKELKIIADAGYPPYSYLEKGEVKGIYTEILRKAFKKVKGFNPKIVAYPWKKGLEAVKKGDVFAIYPPYHHVRKRPYIWPYSIPILDEKLVVFCNSIAVAGRKLRNFPDDFHGVKFGNNAGFSVGGDKFWHAVKRNKIKVIEAKNSEENLRNLANNTVGCYINDKLSVLYELRRLKKEVSFKGLAYANKIKEFTTVSTEQGFLGISAKYPMKESELEAFLQSFNSVIYEMRRSGELEEIVNKYIK